MLAAWVLLAEAGFRLWVALPARFFALFCLAMGALLKLRITDSNFDGRHSNMGALAPDRGIG